MTLFKYKLNNFSFMSQETETETEKTTEKLKTDDVYAGVVFDINVDQVKSKIPAIKYTKRALTNTPEYKGPFGQSFKQNIIAPAINTLNLINAEIKHNITTDTPHVPMNEQHFLDDNGDICNTFDQNAVYAIIRNTTNLSALASLNTQKFNIFNNTSFSKKVSDNFQNNFSVNNDVSYFFCDKLNDNILVSDIVLQSFNHIIKSKIFTNNYYNDEDLNMACEEVSYITLQNLAITIGRTLATCYLNKYIMFNDNNIDNKSFDPLKNKNEFYFEELKPKLLSIFDKIKDNTFNLSELDTLIKPYTFASEQERDLFASLFKASFIESGIAGDPYSIENKVQYQKVFEHLQKTYLQEGSNLLYFLEQQGLITITTNARNIPIIELTEELQAQAILSSRFFKPYISLSNRQMLIPTNEQVYTKVTLSIFQKEFKNKASTNIYNAPNNSFYELIEEVDSTRYKINVELCNNILSIFEEALETSFDCDNSFLQNFCYIIYDLDFAIAFKNTTNIILFKKLMLFALDFTSISNTWLQYSVEKDSAAQYFYNVIKSYKYNILGILNDVYIYKHFNYFFIPKYMAYSGRLFSHPFFLQLQGHKLVKSFVQFYPDKSTYTYENNASFDVFKDHISSMINFKDMGIDLTENHPINDISWFDLQEESFHLHNLYIKSFFQNDVDITFYPQDSTTKDKLDWIFENTKKKKETLYIYALFEAKTKKDISNVIYTKDATSSVTQHISLLMRNSNLANLSNLTSQEPKDLYNTISLEIINTIQAHYNTFLLPIFKLFFEGHIPQDYFEQKIPFQKTPKTLFELLQKELMTYFDVDESPETLAAVIAGKFKTIVDEGKHEKITTALKAISHIPVKQPFLVAHKLDSKSKIYYKKNNANLTINTESLIKYLKITKSLFLLYKFEYISHKPIINRDVLKTLVMPDGYNAGQTSRIDSLNNYYTSCFLCAGYSHRPNNSIYAITNLVNIMYTLIASRMLFVVRSYKNLCHDFVKRKLNESMTQPITIDMLDLLWSLHKYEHDPNKDYRPRIPIKYAKQATIRFRFFTYLNSLDKDAMKISFASIFIHGLDARVVYHLYRIVKHLNKFLRDTNSSLPQISIHTNHDAFGINAPYGYLLKFLVAEAYNRCINENFIKILIGDDKKYQDILKKTKIKCTSLNHFIKH